MSKRLDAVLRVGHEFQGAQSETSHTGVDPSIVKPRGGDRIFGPQGFEQPPPPPPKISVPGIQPQPPSVSITTPDLAGKIVEAANVIGMEESELAQMVTTLLACVDPQETGFLSAFFSVMDMHLMLDEEIAELESDVGQFAISQDTKGILGTSPSLAESIYFFADTTTLLAIRHLEDPCAMESHMNELSDELQTAVESRASKIQMIASMAYPGRESLLRWKQAQTRVFASARLPWMNEDYENETKADDLAEMMEEMGFSVGEEEAPPSGKTMSTNGAALSRIPIPRPGRNIRSMVAMYAILLNGNILFQLPTTTEELMRGHRRIQCLKTLKCAETTDEFVANIYEPIYNLGYMRTLTFGFFVPRRMRETTAPRYRGDVNLQRFQQQWILKEGEVGPRLYLEQMIANTYISLAMLAAVYVFAYQDYGGRAWRSVLETLDILQRNRELMEREQQQQQVLRERQQENRRLQRALRNLT
jgi:hypothetical protein